MRFSAVQEDSYGVGLGQETLPNNVDESMMAATGDVEPGGGNAAEEGSMISNLPLLFANGYPTSLERITLPELERFITFMVQCSLGHDTAEVISKPQWWPKEVKFSIPLIRPKKINETYMANLKKLVFRCYTYHRSEYLLRFCSYLAQYPRDKLEYANNWDSTTSLYLKTTKKLLVTFRNENMNYDRKVECPRRMLLTMDKTKTNYPNGTKCLRRRSAQKQAPSPAMVEPPIDDIYLCDNCDAELVGLYKMKEHEKLCYRVEPRPLTPDYEIEPEIKQDQFMDYFKLKSSKPLDSYSQNNKTFNNDPSNAVRQSTRIRGSVNLTRCPTIPFSSPAGLALGKKSKMMTEAIQQERLERIERHLNAPALSTSLKPKWFTKTYEFDRWSVTYKPGNRDKAQKDGEYVHTYKFGNHTGKPFLSLRAQLLYVALKPIYVVLERQTDEELEELKRDPSRYKSPEPKIRRVRSRSPSVRTVDDNYLGDESHPILIDLEEDEEPTPPRPPPSALPIQAPFYQSRAPIATVTPIIPASADHFLARAINKLPTVTKRTKPPSGSKRPIIYVDLCSSDDEATNDDLDSSPYVSTDENCDPLQKRSTNTTPTATVTTEQRLLRHHLFTPSKVCAKPCIHPADSTSNWLSNLNVDSEPHKDGFLRHTTTPVYNSTP